MGYRKRKSVRPEDRTRASRQHGNARRAEYPVEEWLASEPDDEYETTQQEGFPTITRAHFVQDLHKIARDANHEARERGETLGWAAHTSTKGLPEDEIVFWFERLPIDDCRFPRESGRSRARHRTAPTVAPEAEAIGAQTGIDPARVQAWQTAVVDAYWCATGTASGFTHEIGRAPSFAPCVCAGHLPRTVATKTPPPSPVWEPGQPIPEEIP